MKYNDIKYNENDINYLKKYIQEHNLDINYYNKCIEKLSSGKPIQYIIGEVNFYGYDFKVNEHVLIPRYETELLVDKAIKKIKKLFMNKPVDIIDFGTGSGCIAITLKKELAGNVDALDLSKEALDIAKINAKNNNVNVNFINQDMTTYTDKLYDIIISNPPYIAYDEEIMEIVKNNEPHSALYAANNGLYFYEKIIDNIPKITKEKYLICFEIGCTQSTAIVDIAKTKLKNINISVEKDYANLDRFIFITNIKE